MNKRVFGSNLSSTMNLPHQKKVLQERKEKEAKVHKKEKEIKRLQKKLKNTVKKFKSVKKSKENTKNINEIKVYDKIIQELSDEYELILQMLDALNYSH